MARHSKYNSSHSAMSGCTSILIPIIVIFMMIIKWIQENPTLAVIVLLGIISLILFAVSIFKTPSKKKYQQYNTNYRQNQNDNKDDDDGSYFKLKIPKP